MLLCIYHALISSPNILGHWITAHTTNYYDLTWFQESLRWSWTRTTVLTHEEHGNPIDWLLNQADNSFLGKCKMKLKEPDLKSAEVDFQRAQKLSKITEVKLLLWEARAMVTLGQRIGDLWRSTGFWLAVRGQVTSTLASDWLSDVRWLEHWLLIGCQRSGD